MGKKLNDQPKDTTLAICLLVPEDCYRSLPPPRLLLPAKQLRTFVNGLKSEEAAEVGLMIKLATIAVNFIRVNGWDDDLMVKNLALIAQVALEHPNKRYRAVMAALRKNCESPHPDLHGVVCTLLEAHALLLEPGPDWWKARDIYADRIGIPRG